MRAPVPGEHDADRRAKRSSLKCLWRVRPRGVRKCANESRILFQTVCETAHTYLYRNGSVPFRASGRVAADSGISPALVAGRIRQGGGRIIASSARIPSEISLETSREWTERATSSQAAAT
eukprot:6757023-Prymnesium_polylepis.1